MNEKFAINQTLQFARNNLSDATRMLATMIDESVLPANGELSEMESHAKEIISEARQFKEFLVRVREVDSARKNIIKAVKEGKEETEK